MSINKQKYFLAFLFVLINNAIFISGSYGNNNQADTNNSNSIIVMDQFDNLIGDGEVSNVINKQEIKYQSCEDVQPTNGIISDCTTHSIDNSRSCCYVTINYEYNEFNLCVQTQKDLDIIKNKIDKLEKEYEGCDSVDIDCHSAFINFSFMFLLVVLVF